MKIDIAKKYETMNGEAVTLYTTDHAGEYPVVGCVSGLSQIFMWSERGIHTGFSYHLNLREVNLYKDFKDGDDVVVWDDRGDRKLKRIFCKVDNGRPRAYTDGKNNWTCNGDEALAWDYCIKKEDYDPEIHGQVYSD